MLYFHGPAMLRMLLQIQDCRIDWLLVHGILLLVANLNMYIPASLSVVVWLTEQIASYI